MGTQVISMVGGDGEFSYQRMGVLQENAIRRLEPLMAEAVKQISLPQQGPLHIADFGTSTGRNSINYINFILKCVADRYVHKAGENNGHATCMPEMLVSFIDLPGNDFNNLIQLLASEAKNAKDLAGSLNSANVGRASTYFSAITAGSFYNRLLPKESLHFALSTFSLHWLSQVNRLLFNYSTNLISIFGSSRLLAQVHRTISKYTFYDQFAMHIYTN
jgi:gibberellin A4 carboxyl methyltransferase